MNNLMLDRDRHKLKRWPIIDHYLPVFSGDTRVPVGHVKDIHKEGMGILCQEALPDGKELLIRMELPENKYKKKSVLLKVRSVWSKSTDCPGLFESGLQIEPDNVPSEAGNGFKSYLHNVEKVAAELNREADAPMKEALRHYKENLDWVKTCLTLQNISEAYKYIAEVLKDRDTIQKILKNSSAYEGRTLITIAKLDSELKNQEKQIAQAVELTSWRTSFNPPADAWWWFLDRHLGWGWSCLSFLFTLLTLIYLMIIWTRYLSGGPDVAGYCQIMALLLAMLPGAKFAFTETLPKRIESCMRRMGMGKRHWKQVSLAFTIVPFLLVVVFYYFALPQISEHYRDKGYDGFKTGQLAAAKADYRRSIELNPNDARTHLYLGLFHEDIHDFKTARTEYQIAANSCEDTDICVTSYNNLARLYIIDENYDAAVTLLKQQEKYLEDRPKHIDMADEKYNFYLHKNLGWARFKQGYLAEAKTQLLQAIQIAEDSQGTIKNDVTAAPHCLLAQVLEKEKMKDATCRHWEKCLMFNPKRYPEEDFWYYLAQKKITAHCLKIPKIKRGGQ